MRQQRQGWQIRFYGEWFHWVKGRNAGVLEEELPFVVYVRFVKSI
jgi:hypothetical protein